MLGTILGDAFGGPLEGAMPSAAARAATRRAEAPARWGYTDDGAMFIAVAESLREVGTIEPSRLLDAMARRYEPARGFGRGMKIALRAHEAGVPWREVARQAWPEGSRGNGGAVRAGAVALRRWTSPDELTAAVELATRVTHAHPEAIEAALLQAHLVALVLEDPEVSSLLDRLERRLRPSPFLQTVLPKLREGASDIAATFGTSPLAAESVPAAVAVFLRHPGSFEGAVVAAAGLGGDVDSICALVGCLAGAAHGEEALPKPWLDAIARESPGPGALVDLADAVLDLTSGPV